MLFRILFIQLITVGIFRKSSRVTDVIMVYHVANFVEVFDYRCQDVPRFIFKIGITVLSKGNFCWCAKHIDKPIRLLWLHPVCPSIYNRWSFANLYIVGRVAYPFCLSAVITMIRRPGGFLSPIILFLLNCALKADSVHHDIHFLDTDFEFPPSNENHGKTQNK